MANEKNDDLMIPTFDTSKWTEEQVGFAPYWRATKGASIIARLVQKDTPEDSFVRYLLQAGQDIECFRGGKGDDEDEDSRERVIVKKGEFFTVSVWYSLQDVFDLYLETGLRPWMQLTAVDKVKTSKPGRTAWTWKLLVDPKDKKKADQCRALLQGGYDTSDIKKLLSEGKPLNSVPQKKEIPAELTS